MAASEIVRSVRKISTVFFLVPSICTAESLTWDECVAKTASRNPDILSAMETLKASGQQITGAYSGFFPQLTAGLNYNYSGTFTPVVPSQSGTPDGFSSPAIAPPRSNAVYSASLSGSQNLFSGFQDKAKVDQAKAQEQINLAALETARAKASYDLKAAFAGVIYAQNSIALAQDITRRRENNLTMVNLRFKSGRENRGSLELSQAYLTQAKYELLIARNQLGTAKLQLAKAIGAEDANTLEVTGSPPISEPQNISDFKALVLGSPDYHQSLGQEQSAEAGISLARANFFPTLSLTGVTSNSDSHWPPANNNWSIGAGVSWSFFNGGKDYFATKSASSTYRAAAFTRDGVMRQTLVKMGQLYSSYVEAVEKLKVDQTFARAAGTREAIGRTKYNNGLLSFEDWDAIENDFITRQKNVLQSSRERVTAEAAWEQVQGKSVIP